jgi:hypothetical protein
MIQRIKNIIVIMTLGILCFMIQEVFKAEVSLAQTSPKPAIQSMPKSEKCISQAHLDLAMEMRKLWEEHIMWTRMYLLSEFAGNGDTLNSMERLSKNQEDIGNAIVPYYGKDNGAKFTDLLNNHVLIEAEVVHTTFANDSSGMKAAQGKWEANADEIAAFLNGINQHWSKQSWMDMLHYYLALTTQEILLRFYEDYATDVESFDRIESQALTLADALTDGIVKQFPEKFRGQ